MLESGDEIMEALQDYSFCLSQFSWGSFSDDTGEIITTDDIILLWSLLLLHIVSTAAHSRPLFVGQKSNFPDLANGATPYWLPGLPIGLAQSHAQFTTCALPFLVEPYWLSCPE